MDKFSRRFPFRAAKVAILLLSVVGFAPLCRAQGVPSVVDTAIEVIDTLTTQGDRIPPRMIAGAHAVAIIPDLVKGGLVVGFRRGHGVVLVRDNQGRWQPPAFVTLNGGSLGWQAGIQSTDLVLVFKNQRSIKNLMRGKLTIGVDASAAAGPVGRKAQAATDGRLAAEIYSYSRSRGLFAGVSIDGATLKVDEGAQRAYYAMGLPASATQLIDRLQRYSNPTPMVAQANPAPGDVAAVWAQLTAAHQRLMPLLDDTWRRHLQLPQADAKGQIAFESMQTLLKRFDQVAQDPRYASLNQRPEFRSANDWLRRYVGMVTPPRQARLALPPPPQVIR